MHLPLSATKWAKFVLGLLALTCLMPFVSSVTALVLGIVYAQVFEHPYAQQSKKATGLLLKISVVGLGFGMNVSSALQAGQKGFVLTVFSILTTLVLGYVLQRALGLDKKIAYLISCGTAICGGSAIASVSPVIQANAKQISIALGVVFVLNSVALLIFPYLGNLLNLSQSDFGLWAAIAIHDTSSVVGAAAKYGDQALEVATTVKLARALWVIPLALVSTVLFKNKNAKIKWPYFIGLFAIAMFLNSYVEGFSSISPYLVGLSKSLLTLTLFLIGTSLSVELIKQVGTKVLVLAVVLWITISVSSLLYILYI